MFKRFVAIAVLVAFLANSAVPVYAQGLSLGIGAGVLPAPGSMLALSPSMNPPMLKGIKVYTDDPFRFDFILDKGSAPQVLADLKPESEKLIKYFLASLTVPEKDLWVNLSPYEKDRIIPNEFGQTEMGRDLLAQDYILKQITASLLYPEGEAGKKFWAEVYKKAYAKYGTTDIPVDTFNKVWIVPEKVVVYEKQAVAYIVESHLQVMLESDYLATSKNVMPVAANPANMAKSVLRDIVIPVLEKEVNEGANFAQLRQVYNSFILAAWYKKKIKESLLAQIYVDQKKIQGVNIDDPRMGEKIWGEYVEAFKKGAVNLIREEKDALTDELIPRKYFSGGCRLTDEAMRVTEVFAGSLDGARKVLLPVMLERSVGGRQNAMASEFAMLTIPAGVQALIRQEEAQENERFERQRTKYGFQPAHDLMKQMLRLVLATMGATDRFDDILPQIELRLVKGAMSSKTDGIFSRKIVIYWNVERSEIGGLASEVGHAVHYALRQEHPHNGVAEAYDYLAHRLINVKRFQSPVIFSAEDKKDAVFGGLLMDFIKAHPKNDILKVTTEKEGFEGFLREFIPYAKMHDGLASLELDENGFRALLVKSMRDVSYGFNHLIGAYIFQQLYERNNKDIQAVARQMFEALKDKGIDFQSPWQFLDALPATRQGLVPEGYQKGLGKILLDVPSADQWRDMKKIAEDVPLLFKFMGNGDDLTLLAIRAVGNALAGNAGTAEKFAVDKNENNKMKDIKIVQELNKQEMFVVAHRRSVWWRIFGYLYSKVRKNDIQKDVEEKTSGGIDLSAERMNFSIQNQGGAVQFKITPEQLEKFKNALGFVPVIMGVEPMDNLSAFLMINQQPT
ncbi:MAG: hypothetical protein HQL19_05955 [Candidatus Omnitrophica bacterium]|nr:hypothetical protein [Candidatus Omnitrophota bacterium]